MSDPSKVLAAAKTWTPAAKERALELIEERKRNPRYPFFCPDRNCNGEPHGNWRWNHARADQHPPPGFGTTKRYWVVNSGRGAGKTRLGSELTHQMTKVTPRIALVAPTAADVRGVMVDGISGLLATARPDNYPLYEPSKRLITWPNGCQASVFSGEEPDRIRGRGFGFAWVDEGAHIQLIEDVWRQLRMTMRLPGVPVRTLVTSTPLPTAWMKKLLANPRTFLTRVPTSANRSNLSDSFLEDMADLAGTRIGRQELEGEVLEDVEGALWVLDLIRHVERTDYKGTQHVNDEGEIEGVPALEFEDMDRIIVGVDPQGTNAKRSDETGIVVVGRMGREMFVLGDLSVKAGPDGWGKAAVQAAQAYGADAIVAEKNYGGDMVKHVISSINPNIRIIEVNSRRGKDIRAEPVLAIYEQNRAYHWRVFGKLEEEMTTWVPGSRMSSPNRLDAMVHAATELFPVQTADSSVSSPYIIQRALDPFQRLFSLGGPR